MKFIIENRGVFTHLRKLNVNHEICETSWKEENLFFPNLLICYFANMLINWIFAISKLTYIKWKLVKSFSHIQLFATPWTVVCQAHPSVGFSRQEYWSGLPFHSPGDLPDPEIEPEFPTLQVDSLPSDPPGKPKVKVELSQTVVYIWLEVMCVYLDCPIPKITELNCKLY